MTSTAIIEIVGGVAGGLGLFIAGMWLLSENLKRLASRRLRRTASRWTSNRFSALFCGLLAGGVTQSVIALTIIVVSLLRSGLISIRGALPLILGGSVGASTLVAIVTFDIKMAALYVLGLSGAVVATDRLSRYRPVAAAFLGGSMLILGLLLIKDTAAPLAQQPWFRDLLEGTGGSLAFTFLVAAVLTAVLQSANAVCIFAISLVSVRAFSVDQAIMSIGGSLTGSSAILVILSAGLTGRSRQVAMYMAFYDLLVGAVMVPLLYLAFRLEISSLQSSALAAGLDLDRQLALVYILLFVIPLPFLRHPGMVGIGARTAVAGLAVRRVVEGAIHS